MKVNCDLTGSLVCEAEAPQYLFGGRPDHVCQQVHCTHLQLFLVQGREDPRDE